MNTEPSPRPWRVEANAFGIYIVGADGRKAAQVLTRNANAALIVDAVNQIENARGISTTTANEYAKLGERYNRLLSAMKAIEDLCKVLDRTDLWEDREEWMDDAIYYIRKEARAAIGEEKP